MTLATILCYFELCLFASVVFGDCIVDDIAVQSDFDADKYMGKWYEYRWYTSAHISSDSVYQDYCHHYIPTLNGTTTYVSWRFPNNNSCHTSDESFIPTATPGKYVVTDQDEATHWPYWVLDTDYTQYAFVYGCYNISSSGTCNGARAWIFSRTPEIPQIIRDKETDFYTRVCLNSSAFYDTEQTNVCKMPKHYKIHPNQNCQVSNIQVQENFDKRKYRGLWYESRWVSQSVFPESMVLKNYQHEVFLDNNGKMTVYARARLGRCIYRKGVLEAGGPSGKYIYTTTSTKKNTFQYWVIDTDYENYALVYQCSDVSSSGECAHVGATVWSRRPILFPKLQRRANSILQRLCINPATFIWTPQDKTCPPKWTEVSCKPNAASAFSHSVYIPILISFVSNGVSTWR